MAIDTTTPHSPGWWLQRLLDKLNREHPRFDRLNNYYEGINGIPVHADDACKEAFRRLMRVSRTNWAALSIEAALERMVPVGFRTGVAGDQLGDDRAWEIWQANGLDLGAPMTFEAAMAMSCAAMIVGDIDEETGVPLITPEDPREVTWETDPRNRRRVLAGLKVFRDDVNLVDRAYLYLPGAVWRAVSPLGASTPEPVTAPLPVNAAGWEWESADQLPKGVQPLVPFVTDPKMNGTGRGAFEKHLPLLDRINYLMLQELQIVTLQAFRQRAISGDLPDTDEHGNEIDYDDIFAADPGALWRIPETAKIWESGEVNLQGLVLVCREPVKDFAAVSGTPLFYLTPEATDGSAEGASLARERLLFRTERYTKSFTESLERTMSTAFRVLGDEPRADRTAMEVIWEAPERWSLAQMADADMKAAKGGSLTRRQRRERIWKMTPQEIAQAEEDDAAEALLAASAALTSEVLGGSNPAGQQPAG